MNDLEEFKLFREFRSLINIQESKMSGLVFFPNKMSVSSVRCLDATRLSEIMRALKFKAQKDYYEQDVEGTNE